MHGERLASASTSAGNSPNASTALARLPVFFIVLIVCCCSAGGRTGYTASGRVHSERRISVGTESVLNFLSAQGCLGRQFAGSPEVTVLHLQTGQRRGMLRRPLGDGW